MSALYISTHARTHAPLLITLTLTLTLTLALTLVRTYHIDERARSDIVVQQQLQSGNVLLVFARIVPYFTMFCLYLRVFYRVLRVCAYSLPYFTVFDSVLVCLYLHVISPQNRRLPSW